mmetsp:Transcript_101487/g.287555  ORF Transcript_101487/g.287555 Transcript_101487/m.287555 type:complete len:661 (-) Transcript_101487:93-2075(-)
MSAQESCILPQKLRLNVVVLRNGEIVKKLLVCIDDDAYLDQLEAKIRATLARNRVEGRLLQVVNNKNASLPAEECIADLFRDSEEIVAVLVEDDSRNEDQAQEEAKEESQAVQESRGEEIRANAEEEATIKIPPDSPEKGAGTDTEGGEAKAPLVAREQETQTLREERPPPGPSETFEEDLRKTPRGGSRPAKAPVVEWAVEKLTPKLREYISTRFSEAYTAAVDMRQSSFVVTMCPQHEGAEPVHFNIARIDIVEFESLTGRKVMELRHRLENFRRCRASLTEELGRSGVSSSDYKTSMLPYSYRADMHTGTLLSEVDTIGQVEGFRPLIVIDTSGAVADSWVYIQGALKRMLYSFIVAKSKFNLVKFTSRGTAALERGMVPPTAQKLREAEEWLDAVVPAQGSVDFAGGIRWALGVPEADAVYLVTSGFRNRKGLDAVATAMREGNSRKLPVHVIGIDCGWQAELELRRLAEDHHGSFRQKRFDDHAGDAAAGAQQLAMVRGSNEDTRLTVGGQVDIFDIMIREHEVQVRAWLEEQRCANRVLLTTATQKPLPIRYADLSSSEPVPSMRGPAGAARPDWPQGALSGKRGIIQLAQAQRSYSTPRPASAPYAGVRAPAGGASWAPLSAAKDAQKLASRGHGAAHVRASKRSLSARKHLV